MTGPTRRALLRSGAAGLVLAGLGQGASGQGLPDSFAGRGPILNGQAATVTRVPGAGAVVALTFDDGPHPVLTPRLLDLLGAYGLRATFYVIGSTAERHPEILRRIAAEGHEIGNHTFSHPDLSRLPDAAILDQVDRTNRVVFDAVGRPPVTLRPPYGLLHDRQRLMLFAERGLPTILWSVDPQDWRRPAPVVISQRILGGCEGGGVVLAHDIHAPTLAAMPAVIDGLAARGLGFVTVSELIGWPRWDRRRLRLVAA